MEATIAVVEKAAGYAFSDAALLERALTHPSCDEGPDYERLEFLGDSVLDLVSAEWFCAAAPDAAEGKLTAWRAACVSGSALADAARILGLDSQIKTGASITGALPSSSCAAVLEAVVGAVYMDGGLEAARAVALRWLEARFRACLGGERSPKERLQEHCQALGEALPVYRVVEETGPKHDLIFTVEADHDGNAARGEGPTKKDAEQAAAAQLLALLDGAT